MRAAPSQAGSHGGSPSQECRGSCGGQYNRPFTVIEELEL